MSQISNDLEAIDVDELVSKCDNLLDLQEITHNREQFLLDSIKSYKKALYLFGFFSKLQNFSDEMMHLNNKLIAHKEDIINSYKDLISTCMIKYLILPFENTSEYQRGQRKFFKVRNYLIYHYRNQLLDQMSVSPKQINCIRNLVCKIDKLDIHYDIYSELIDDLQKKNSDFQQIMDKHLNEFIHF